MIAEATSRGTFWRIPTLSVRCTTEQGPMASLIHLEETRMNSVFLVFAFTATAVMSAHAQDAVKVDPKHYKVEFENERVRVLRVSYAPGEKSVMHEHPENVAVFLTDGRGKFTLPDGKSEEVPIAAGTTRAGGAEKHIPENVGDQPFELILVELKGSHGH
jgi:quercetin dioxygenase-like cupin family protein